MTNLQTLEIAISGMDCAECTQHVQQAIEKLHGVHSVQVFLGAEKALVHLDLDQAGLPEIRAAVRAAGYDVPAADVHQASSILYG